MNLVCFLVLTMKIDQLGRLNLEVERKGQSRREELREAHNIKCLRLRIGAYDLSSRI